jgi:serine/threonine protein kinase
MGNINSVLPDAQLHYAPNATLAAPVDDDRGASRSTAAKLRLGLHLPLRNKANEQRQGALLGAGVREDLDNPGFVIKSGTWELKEAEKESELFNRFYGKYSSEIFAKDGQLFMRMLKVPGKSLDQVEPEELPSNSKELFLQMLCDLNDVKIIHGDLHPGNVMYDSGTNRFWPIDISNAYDAYYSDLMAARFMDGDNQTRLNQIMRMLPKMSDDDPF